MKKTTLFLVFYVGFLFLCIPQLFAVEKDESSWIDFFSLLPSEEPAKIDTATNHPIEFRICDSEQYVQTQIADWNKRFRMNEPKEDEE